MKPDELRALSMELAAELSAADFPNLWRIGKKSDAWYQQLTTRDAWLMLSVENSRVVVSADRPREMARAEYPEKITVDANRTPEAIAKDITRRLLPAARKHFQKCREATRKEKERKQAHTVLLNRLQQFTRWKNTHDEGKRTQWYSHRTKADLYSDEIYELRIEKPTIEEALQILAILEPQKEPQP